MTHVYKIRTIRRLCLAAVACIAVSACGGGKYKPPEPAKLEKFEQSVVLSEQWELDSGHSFENNLSTLQPAFADGRIYAATLNGRLSALDSGSGSRIWSVETGEALSAAVGASENLLAVVTESGDVVGRSPDSGAELWRHPLGRVVIGTPVVFRGGVFIRSIDGSLVGLDAATGEQLWAGEFDQPNFTLRSTAPLHTYGDSIVVGNASGQVVGFDADVGITNWKISTGARRLGDVERLENANTSSIIIGHTLYAAALPDSLVAYDLRNLQRLWSATKPIGNRIAGGSLHIFAVGGNSEIFAVDRLSGEQIWSQPALLHRGIAAMAQVGNYLVAADNLGVMHVISVDSGEFVGRLNTRKRVISEGLYSQGEVLHAAFRSGELRAYSIAVAK